MIGQAMPQMPLEPSRTLNFDETLSYRHFNKTLSYLR